MDNLDPMRATEPFPDHPGPSGPEDDGGDGDIFDRWWDRLWPFWDE